MGEWGSLLLESEKVVLVADVCPHGLGGTEARHVGCPMCRFCFAFVSWCLGLGKKKQNKDMFEEVRRSPEICDNSKGTWCGAVLN